MFLGLRAILALLLGLTSLMMVILAIALPRATTIIVVQVFAGFAILDGLLCLLAAARGSQPGRARAFMAIEGLVELGTAAVAFVLVGNLVEGSHRILTLAALWAIVTGILELIWVFSISVSRGRVLLTIAALLSVAFGVMLLGARPPDLLTAMWRFAVYILLLGVLRALVAFSVRR